jgi:hypothetical protein
MASSSRKTAAVGVKYYIIIIVEYYIILPPGSHCLMKNVDPSSNFSALQTSVPQTFFTHGTP